MTRPALLSAPPVVVRILRLLPLKARGGLFILCGLLLVFAVFGGFSVFTLRRSAERATEWTLRSAQVAAEQIEFHLRHHREGVETLARWPGIASTIESLQSGRTDVSPPWVTLYYLSSDTHDYTDCVFVTDKQGTVMWTKPAGLGLLNQNLIQYADVRAALEGGEPRTSNLLQDDFWPEPHILVTTAIRNAQNAVIGVVGNVVGATRLKQGELFAEVSSVLGEARSDESFVVDAEGVIVTATDPRRVFTRADEALLRVRSERGRNAFSVELGDKMMALHPLGTPGWHVVVAQPSRSLYSDVYQLERKLAILAIGLTMFALVVWIPFVESFINPIRNLTDESDRIAAGDLSHPITDDGRDEIAKLSRSLDDMRLQIREDQEHLKDQLVKLGEVNRLKTEFIATLSHEFRTPMHIMHGYLDLIREGTFGEVPKSILEPLDAVDRQYATLWEIVESCLDLAQIDAGKDHVILKTFDLNAIVREVISDFLPQLREKGLGTQLRLLDDECRVTSDEVKIKRILHSLVSNAMKFTDTGAIEVAVHVSPHPSTVMLSVRDTGIGIAEKDHQIIFERFRQVDGSARRRFGGVGLGLSIASELAGLLGGTITVKSKVQAGSTFSLVLPHAGSVQ